MPYLVTSEHQNLTNIHALLVPKNEVVMMLCITKYGTDARKGRDVVTSWSVHVMMYAYIPAFLRPPEAQTRPPSACARHWCWHPIRSSARGVQLHPEKTALGQDSCHQYSPRGSQADTVKAANPALTLWYHRKSFAVANGSSCTRDHRANLRHCHSQGPGHRHRRNSSARSSLRLKDQNNPRP